MLKQAIAEVLEIGVTLTNVRVLDPLEASLRIGVDPLRRRFRREPAFNGLANALQPTAILGEHPIGFDHLLVFAAVG